MAELLRTHPLESRADALAAAGITVEPYVAMTNVRGEPPVAANTWADVDGGRAIWLGPDEWLLTSADEAPEDLETRTGGTDVSAQRITLRLAGARARDLLAGGCAIDLHPRVFGPGQCVQTRLAQAAVVLLREEDEYVVLVRSSFAGYLADWLLDAAAEYR
ncbi:sarcosine oxidase subunit gamma [Cryptosporangium phraense]|uniref:Sarcosine oxidase subunit gamma n=1 Tax=Cryptosporangium phraense TaxID=2593070 RepID=A0A545AH94_9ACTN|nr:sarcosine oxidase subunit gamma family protein [Cryptosporangium phraense]TQS40689.1 sarcosine oxidase subunit gamma [Cryptosporangium phraense]